MEWTFYFFLNKGQKLKSSGVESFEAGNCLSTHESDKYLLTCPASSLREDLCWVWTQKSHWVWQEDQPHMFNPFCLGLRLPVTYVVFYRISRSEEDFWCLELKTEWLSWWKTCILKEHIHSYSMTCHEFCMRHSTLCQKLYRLQQVGQWYIC